MFLAYWPVLSLVVSIVLVAVVFLLKFADKLCRARHHALPDRNLNSYLPGSDDDGLPVEDPALAATSELPPELVLQMQPPNPAYEPSIAYSASHSAHGSAGGGRPPRREFEI